MKRIMVAALFAVVLVSILLLATPMTGSATGNFYVYPPDAHPFGLTYAQWAAKWWQWELKQPEATNPNFNLTGCSNVQSGPVWFLAGTFGGAPVERTCTIPFGRSILFPVMNTIALATTEKDTVQKMRHDAKHSIDRVKNYGAEIDGVSLNKEYLASFRLYQGELSDLPVFRVTFPEVNGIFGFKGSYYPCSDDGVYLMLAPLLPGEHNIHFYATKFNVNVTYHLTVAP